MCRYSRFAFLLYRTDTVNLHLVSIQIHLADYQLYFDIANRSWLHRYSRFAFRLYPAQTQSQTESDAKRIHQSSTWEVFHFRGWGRGVNCVTNVCDNQIWRFQYNMPAVFWNKKFGNDDVSNTFFVWVIHPICGNMPILFVVYFC